MNRATPNNKGSGRGGVANRILHGVATTLGNSRFQQEHYGTNLANIQTSNTIVRNEATINGDRHVRPHEIEDDDVLGTWVRAPPPTAIMSVPFFHSRQDSTGGKSTSGRLLPLYGS